MKLAPILITSVILLSSLSANAASRYEGSWEDISSNPLLNDKAGIVTFKGNEVTFSASPNVKGTLLKEESPDSLVYKINGPLECEGPDGNIYLRIHRTVNPGGYSSLGEYDAFISYYETESQALAPLTSFEANSCLTHMYGKVGYWDKDL